MRSEIIKMRQMELLATPRANFSLASLFQAEVTNQNQINWNYNCIRIVFFVPFIPI